MLVSPSSWSSESSVCLLQNAYNLQLYFCVFTCVSPTILNVLEGQKIVLFPHVAPGPSTVPAHIGEFVVGTNKFWGRKVIFLFVTG